MNDQMFAPSAPFTPREAFIGADGYARQIHDLAYEVMGEHERGLIPLDSEVAWMAGKTYLDVMELARDDPEKADQFHRNGPYGMKEVGDMPLNNIYLGTAADWKEIEDAIDWVHGCWLENVGPDPDQFDTMVSSAADAATALYNEHTGVGSADAPYRSASTAVEGWESEAGRDFRDHYWYRLPGVIGNQAATAAVLAHGASAIRAAWSRHRADLEDIAKKTLAALEAVKTTSGADFSSFLTITGGLLSIAGGIIAIPASGGGSLALAGAGVSIVSGAITVAQGTVGSEGEDTQEVPLGGETVQSVLFNMSSAVASAKAEITGADRTIAKGLNGVYDTVCSGETAHDSGVDTSDLPDQYQPPADGLTYRDLYVFPAPLIVGPSQELPEPPMAT